jgi:hypothetical protein
MQRATYGSAHHDAVFHGSAAIFPTVGNDLPANRLDVVCLCGYESYLGGKHRYGSRWEMIEKNPKSRYAMLGPAKVTLLGPKTGKTEMIEGPWLDGTFVSVDMAAELFSCAGEAAKTTGKPANESGIASPEQGVERAHTLARQTR